MSASTSIRVVPAAGPAARGVGKYRYIAMLAEGGMADVYLAVTRGAGFEKLVVIKQLRADLAADPTFVAMFMNEAGLAARLNHPNVVQTHEVGVDDGVHFLAMEFLEGVPYVRLARMRDRLPAPLAFHVRVLTDALHGLHYAHELRDYSGAPLDVVHRDVSPHNLMITFAGGVKVLDFGIAKAALAVEQRPDDFKGKLEYMAPEQARLEPLDRRADLFATGVMLWEALARRRLYMPGEEKYERLVSGGLPNILTVRPDVPRKLANICTKAMAHDARNRYATALEMANDLEEWLDSTGQRVSARDVGAYVAEKFATTRARLSEAIEAQLETFRTLGDTAGTMPLARIPFTEVPVSMTATDPPPYAIPMAPTTEPSWTGVTGTGTAASTWTREPPPPIQQSPWPSTAPPRPAPAPSTHASSAAFAAVLVASAALAAGGFAAYRFTGSRAAAPPPQTVLAPEAASARPAAPAETPQIDFTIRASPPEARIWIDGQATTGNPATGRRPRDGAIHIVRVEAPGHEPKEEQLSFDRSLFVTFDLRPAATGPAATAPTPTATTTAAPTTQVTHRAPPPPPPRRSPPPVTPKPRAPGSALDTENPYQ